MNDGGKGKFKSIIQDFKVLCLLILLILVWKTVTSFFFHASCPMVLITGFPCPGCGISRGFYKILQGDFSSAMRSNPSIFVWILWCCVFFYGRYIQKRKGFVIVCLVITVIICLGIYLYRMIFFFPGEPPLTFYYKSILGQSIPYYHDFISGLLK